MRLTVLEFSFTGEEEEEEEGNDDFRFFSKFVFLASIKLSWNQRTYLYSGGSGFSIDIHFVDLELVMMSFLPSLPIILYCQTFQPAKNKISLWRLLRRLQCTVRKYLGHIAAFCNNICFYYKAIWTKCEYFWHFSAFL